ncbi:MAG: CoA-disulfide reductase [Nitrospinae bacterium CG11_big_fil_rev_8_21_14_0_20_56_8]|nr:MAG: CoA-disulfide reductase [Nitrospinae bacterium CG11_big_fil_rev_8_21_14_0_20_56_8]
MSGKKIVVVGGVAGGASAAACARRLSEAAEIVVLERGPHVSFANCGLPYFVGGEIPDRDDLLVQTPASLRARHNLDVRPHHTVVRIDRDAREVEVHDTAQDRTYREHYDALILATGAAPLIPPIPGIRRDGHFTVRSVPDVEAILSWIDARNARQAVVVGGGYIGLEMAEQLHRRGLQVAIAEALPQVMAPLDAEMAAWLHRELKSNGVALHLGSAVAAFENPREDETAKASVVVLNNGTRLPADVVILGLGVRPESQLARDAGLDLGERGGIRVDETLRTSDPHIWAVGDAIEVKDGVTGQNSLIPLAGPANRQGRIAAENIFGSSENYSKTWGTAIIRLLGLSAACTGANERMLRKLGRPVEAVYLHPYSHADYYPGAHRMAMKLLFDPASARLLGAQVVGKEGVDKRIDVLATALKAGFTAHDLADLELAYAPPFGSAKDPVNLAGMVAQHVLQGEVKNAQWYEIATLDSARAVVLDVREDSERTQGAIPHSLHIPLGQIRARMGELPRDREIIVHCQTGQRSYFACRILAQNGFSVRNLSGSYRTWEVATGE